MMILKFFLSPGIQQINRCANIYKLKPTVGQLQELGTFYNFFSEWDFSMFFQIKFFFSFSNLIPVIKKNGLLQFIYMISKLYSSFRLQQLGDCSVNSIVQFRLQQLGDCSVNYIVQFRLQQLGVCSVNLEKLFFVLDLYLEPLD